MKNDITMNDYILMIAAALLLIFSGSIVFWSSVVKNNSVSQSLPPKIIGQATLTIDFGNDKKRAFEGDIINNETLIDALIQASKAGNFSYKLDEKISLAAIDSFSRENGKSWHWYLNGKKIDKPLNKVIAKDGDNILIKYE